MKNRKDSMKELKLLFQYVCEWTFPALCHISPKLLNFKVCGSHSNANAWPSALSLKKKKKRYKKPEVACCGSRDLNHCHYELSGSNHSGCAQGESLLMMQRSED